MARAVLTARREQVKIEVDLRKHKYVSQSLNCLVPQNKREFAHPLLNDSLSTSIAACFEHNLSKASTLYGTVNSFRGCISICSISNHIAHADFARCSLSFWLPAIWKWGKGRRGGVGVSSEIGLAFVARFLKTLTSVKPNCLIFSTLLTLGP